MKTEDDFQEDYDKDEFENEDKAGSSMQKHKLGSETNELNHSSPLNNLTTDSSSV